jgi:site-specific DNA recombinase
VSGTPTDTPVTDSRRAAVYLRVSTVGQAETDYGSEGFSIPAQREACLRTAERLCASVVDE